MFSVSAHCACGSVPCEKGRIRGFQEKFEALNGSSWETDREDYVFYADEMLQAIREALPNQSENAELADWITNGEKRYH